MPTRVDALNVFGRQRKISCVPDRWYRVNLELESVVLEFRKKVFSSINYSNVGVSAGAFGFTAQALRLVHKAVNYESSAQHIVGRSDTYQTW